ncbi:MAG: hypothetical protein ACI3VX_03330, partial [Faecousia sp.]
NLRMMHSREGFVTSRAFFFPSKAICSHKFYHHCTLPMLSDLENGQIRLPATRKNGRSFLNCIVKNGRIIVQYHWKIGHGGIPHDFKKDRKGIAALS